MQFHVLSFEGPDPYAQAGGIATRVSGLTDGLVKRGFPTYLWFIGDPELAGAERVGSGVELRRWCQWISRQHPAGVYAGEEHKRLDYVTSLPPYLCEQVLFPHLRENGRAVVLAEEWQTVDAVLHLDWLLRRAGLRDRVTILWNANNTFGFDRIDWSRLTAAATVTTVSRYMRQLLRGIGVDPIVIANGLAPDALVPPDASAVSTLRHRFRNRALLGKVGRWDPDKNWLLAVETVAELKRAGWRPLLIARGGVESHGAEVLSAAQAAGLHVIDRAMPEPGARGLLAATADINGADIVSLRSPLDAQGRGVLFRGASAVLANSSHEPFGLVGLEAMAAGGLVCTGCSGEDYAVPDRNAIVLQTSEPREFIGLFERIWVDPEVNASLRRAARETAEQFAWSEIIERTLLPRVRLG